MKSTNHLWRLLAALLALSLFAAACGGDDDDDVGSTGDGDEDASDDVALDACDTLELSGDVADADFTGVSVAVGSKDFAEQRVLGAILVEALEAKGATVVDKTNLGGTSVVRDAMIAGEVDASFEYNGTGWTNHLGRDNPSFDSDQLSANVCVNDLEENNVRWLGRSPFNNTYGFATGPDFLDDGEPFTLDSMAEYIDENSDATVCLETEFPTRPDGLVLFEDATGVVIPESQIQVLDTGVIYDETASGNCDFGEIFTTDGRIPALGLNLVEDPGVFIVYNVSLTLPDSVYEQAPESWDALTNAILEPLTNEKMAELNARVSADGEDPSTVAADYLVEIGVSG